MIIIIVILVVAVVFSFSFPQFVALEAPVVSQPSSRSSLTELLHAPHKR
jgi:hypothetical protein